MTQSRRLARTWSRRPDADGIELVRNPEFREWSGAAQPDGFVDAISWRFDEELASAFDRLSAGELDCDDRQRRRPEDLASLQTRPPGPGRVLRQLPATIFVGFDRPRATVRRRAGAAGAQLRDRPRPRGRAARRPRELIARRARSSRRTSRATNRSVPYTLEPDSRRVVSPGSRPSASPDRGRRRHRGAGSRVWVSRPQTVPGARRDHAVRRRGPGRPRPAREPEDRATTAERTSARSTAGRWPQAYATQRMVLWTTRARATSSPPQFRCGADANASACATSGSTPRSTRRSGSRRPIPRPRTARGSRSSTSSSRTRCGPRGEPRLHVRLLGPYGELQVNPQWGICSAASGSSDRRKPERA